MGQGAGSITELLAKIKDTVYDSMENDVSESNEEVLSDVVQSEVYDKPFMVSVRGGPWKAGIGQSRSGDLARSSRANFDQEHGQMSVFHDTSLMGYEEHKAKFGNRAGEDMREAIPSFMEYGVNRSSAINYTARPYQEIARESVEHNTSIELRASLKRKGIKIRG